MRVFVVCEDDPDYGHGIGSIVGVAASVDAAKALAERWHAERRTRYPAWQPDTPWEDDVDGIIERGDMFIQSFEVAS